VKPRQRFAQTERFQHRLGHLAGEFTRQRLRLIDGLAIRLHRGADAVADGAVLWHFLERGGVDFRRLGRRALGRGFLLDLGNGRHECILGNG